MMTLKQIEKCVSEGLVLDKNGHWYSIDAAIAEENEYLHHLENGEILDNGKWVRLDDLLEKESPQAETDNKTIQKVSEEDVRKSSEPAKDILRVESVVGREDKTRIQDTSPALRNPADILETKVLSKAVSEEIDKSVVKQSEVEPAKAKESEKELSKKVPAKIEKSEIKLSEIEPAETKVSGKKPSDILKTEGAGSTQSKSPSIEGLSSEETLDEWDKARSKNTKLFIISAVGIIIIILIVITRLLL